MTERTYPYVAWVLTPQFKPVQKTFVSKYEGWSNKDYGDNVEGGGIYERAYIFMTLEAAIEWARKDIERQQAAIDKKQANLDKRKANVAKAEASKPA